MGKTMDKADVKYRASIATFDVREVARISGKPVNGAIKTAIENAKKAVKAGTMKAGEGKIGLIDGHLYLRIKDGSSHEDDFLIVKNFTATPTAPVRDQQYQTKVNDYIRIRTDAFNQLVAGEKEIKTRLARITDLYSQVQDLVEEAKRFGMNNPGDRAADLLRQAILLAGEAETLFKDEVHAPFEAHRTYKSPAGVEDADITEYARPWYLAKWRPKYGTADEYRKLCQSTVGQIRAAAKNARNFADHADQTKANYVSMVDELAMQAEGELKAASKVWGLQPIEGVAEALDKDVERITSLKTTPKITEQEKEVVAQRNLQTANERVVMMANSLKRLQKHVAKMEEITSQVAQVPKDQLKVGEVKAAIKRIETARKGLATYVKACEKHGKNAAAAFGRVKKAAANA